MKRIMSVLEFHLNFNPILKSNQKSFPDKNEGEKVLSAILLKTFFDRICVKNFLRYSL